METINNVVNTASKAIWGESKPGVEPVNGQTGAGTASQPFDKGNEDATTSTTDSSIPSTNPASSGAVPDDTTSTTDSSIPSTNPASSGAVPHQKQQGADRPTDEPNAEEAAAISSKKEAAEDSQDKSIEIPSSSQTKITSDQQREELAEKGELPHDPNDHSGEPMHMHNAGAKSDPEGGNEGESMKQKTERSASVAHEGGGEHGKEQGTGEKWVKTSGVAAEGGDFDVTKPGAGREATRIMEEKGIKTENATIDPNAEKPESPSPAEKEKVSKMAKLKEKMHIGSSKHA